MNNGSHQNTSRTKRIVIFLLSSSLGPFASAATNLDLTPIPLFLGGVIEPNIMYTQDNSGSMAWSYMPDGIRNEYNDERGKAANYNRVYYDPTVTYEPPLAFDGTSLPNADFNNAWEDGYFHYVGAGTCTFDLATEYRPSWRYGDNCDGTTESQEFAGNSEAAYYYVFYENHPQGPQSPPTNCTTGDEDDDDCYLKVVVSSTSGPGGIDERTNFANWYSYYRRRVMASKAAVGRAFAQQGTGLRVGYGAINKGSSDIDGVSTPVIRRGVRKFEETARQEFFNLLYGEPNTESGTPLRRAADYVGRYFQRDDSKGPWSSTPGDDGGNDLECRQSYHIIMSDGYWNGNNPIVATGNQDGTSGPNGYQAISPYTDDASNTLADVAMYYWKNDLRPNLADEVPTNSADPASWQHLVTFTIAFGLQGTVDKDEAFAAIGDPNVTIEWPNPIGAPDADPSKIDDMLHAAINGHGDYFSTSNPTEFAEALRDALATIGERTSSAASVALNSGSVSNESRLYQARFNTGDWSGSLIAFDIESNGSLTQVTNWAAEDFTADPNTRVIATSDGTTGNPFRWTALSDDQKAALLGVAPTPTTDPPFSTDEEAQGARLLAYLRGSQANEGTIAGKYRLRNTILGDIINSAPTFAGDPSEPYPDYWGSGAPENADAYTAFRSATAGRTPMLYVGANDGMLHAFNGDDGTERFAYIPSVLLPELPNLAALDYVHQYYVDGTPTVLDAYFNEPGTFEWRTVLVGGLNAGGQGLYALDVTDPDGIVDEDDVAARVLWEFTDANDADLGYTFSEPNIVRLANGEWGVIVGNGLNNTVADGNASSSGNAVLYILDIETGAIIQKIDTGEGSDDDPLDSLNVNRPNGLASVAPIDVDGDYIIDYAYAGDFFGNLWKFDLRGSNPAAWGLAYTDPVFRARHNPADATTAQPITTRPQVIRHPYRPTDLLVLFGTGKYLEVGDDEPAGQTTQSVYAIWDRGSSSLIGFTRANLLKQEITQEVDLVINNIAGGSYRITTDKAMSWYTEPDKNTPPAACLNADPDDDPQSGCFLGWYMDLINTENGNTDNRGERQVSEMLVRNGRLIFTTLTPTSSPCDFGGEGWFMELDVTSGGTPPISPFDINADGSFSDQDLIDLDGDGDGDTYASGRKSEVGIIPRPSIIAAPDDGDSGGGILEYKYTSGSSGDIETFTGQSPLRLGRQSWRDLFL